MFFGGQMIKYISLLIVFVLISCNTEKKQIKEEATKESSDKQMLTSKPDVLSNWDELDNIDSPAFYKDETGAYVITTAKSTDQLVVYNAVSGNVVKRVGTSGTDLGQFDRPNGIWVYGNLCFVVERDNKRLQILELPDFKPLLTFGEDKLDSPYGLTVFRKNGTFNIYITDNYEFEKDVIPADSLLDKRVLHYTFEYKAGMIDDLKFVKYIGETTGDGVLRVVESINADPVNDNLLIAEELEGEGKTCIKVYDLAGNYKNTIGLGLFKSQAEGLALIRCNTDGYWISTDQSKESNIFHFFDRKTFKLVSSFESIDLKNTDGIWLTQESFDVNSKGAFIAVNDDGGIGVWNLEALLLKMDIKCDNSTPDKKDENTTSAIKLINKLLLSLYVF